MHELYCYTDGYQTKITPIVGGISWRSNIDELGVQLDFDVIKNDLIPKSPVDLGALIVLVNKDEIFRGMAVTEQTDGKGSMQYNVFDFAFHLNKSKAVYQFKKVTAEAAIKKILTDFKIPIGKIACLKTLINKIYPQDTVSDIIKDILEIVRKTTGHKYVMEMRKGKLYIEKQADLVIKAEFTIINDLAPVDVMQAIANPSRKRSIEEMKNSIKIISGDEKSTKVVGTAQNQSLINKYGLLQEVQSVEKKDVAKAKNIAANLLKSLAKIFEENTIELPGDDRVRAGRIIVITEKITGMSGKYLIKDVTHSIKNGIHTMQLGLGVV